MTGIGKIRIENNRKPVIGVFVNDVFFQNQDGKIFAGKLMQANEKVRCRIYFFAPDEIDWPNRKINGYYFDEQKKRWLAGLMPFPDIIYDRAVPLNRNQDELLEDIRKRFRSQPEIQFINSCKLEKWKVYLKLSKHAAVKKYLPHTVLCRNLADIKRMLIRYGFIFLKTSGGSGGKGVYAIKKKNTGFQLRFYRHGIHQKLFVPGFGSLSAALRGIISGIQDKIAVQQGIHLAKYRGRRLDLRVLMVKDKGGKWNAVYNQARVAQKGTVITNLSLGGEVMDYSAIYPALKTTYPHIPDDKAIRKLGITFARYIEKEFGPFGEIGLDIAVDENGRVWLLEANSKPSKLPEQEIEDTVGISPQFLMTLEYARLLFSRPRLFSGRI